jgi:hypothetical protein
MAVWLSGVTLDTLRYSFVSLLLGRWAQAR